MDKGGGARTHEAVRRPVLAITQGDPAGVGPELLVRLLVEWTEQSGWSPLVIAQSSALEVAARSLSARSLGSQSLSTPPTAADRATSRGAGSVDRESRWAEVGGELFENRRLIDPRPDDPPPVFGRPTEAGARAALRAVDIGLGEVLAGRADALVTLPVSKEQIARWVDPTFRGHTEYIAAKLGEARYGRDYLMTFLAADLKVALLSTHLPLRQALDEVSSVAVLAALECLHRNGGGRLAVAGFNPHAGEGGLLGSEETTVLRPAIAAARAAGIDVVGPLSPDTVFLRARQGEFDWVLALYHDQGLIAVKTVSWGAATNYTLGLPILRTSVDHGTAFGIAGRGVADVAPLRAVIDRTLELLAKRAGCS